MFASMFSPYEAKVLVSKVIQSKIINTKKEKEGQVQPELNTNQHCLPISKTVDLLFYFRP